MAEIDLATALQMYSQGMQQAATSNALTTAAEQMNSINSGILKEHEKRGQLQSLGNNLALQLAGIGAQPHQINAAMGAIMPQQFSSPDEAIQQGMMSGNQGLVELGTQASDTLFKKDIKKFALQEGMRERADQRRFEREVYLQQLKNQPELAKTGKLTSDDINRISEFDSTLDFGEGILTKINQLESKGQLGGVIGPIASKKPAFIDPQGEAARAEIGQFFNNYRKLITGASASPDELARLEKDIPNISDRPSVFNAKMKSMLQTTQRLKDRQLKNLGLGGKDVRQFVRQRMDEEAVKQQERDLEERIKRSQIGE
jgi:hypothetical protein